MGRTHEGAHEDVGEELREHELRVAQVELNVADAQHPHLVPRRRLKAPLGFCLDPLLCTLRILACRSLHRCCC